MTSLHSSRWITGFIFSVILFFITIGCASSGFPLFQPTPTLTPSPTSTVTPTPTYTPTSTPEPTLDFGSAVLRLNDLPGGFTTISIETGGTNQKYFGFENDKNFEIISGMTMLLTSESDFLGMDTVIGNPEIITTLLGAGLGDSKFTNIKTLPNMNMFGDSSNGYTSATTFAGLSFRADFFGMRNDKVGAFVLILYKSGATPAITIQDIAKILSQRINEVTR